MEELFTNMVKYNPDVTGDIDVSITASDNKVTVILQEYGVDEFDVTTPIKVDTDAPLDARTPGGLGLFLIQNLVDTLDYEYDDGRSRVIFTKTSGIKHGWDWIRRRWGYRLQRSARRRAMRKSPVAHE